MDEHDEYQWELDGKQIHRAILWPYTRSLSIRWSVAEGKRNGDWHCLMGYVASEKTLLFYNWRAKVIRYQILTSTHNANAIKTVSHTHAVSAMSPDQHCSESSQANRETSCVPSPFPAHELSSLLPELNTKRHKRCLDVKYINSVTNEDTLNYCKDTYRVATFQTTWNSPTFPVAWTGKDYRYTA